MFKALVARVLVRLATAAVCGVGLAISGCSLQDVGPPPAIVLITVDTLRADHLGVYGYDRDTSPNVDAFARENVLFRRAYAHAPETAPSLSSLFSGFYPHENQVTTNLMAFPEDITTFVEVLRDAGYHTGAVVSNYVLRAESQFHQGFDDYDSELPDRELVRDEPERAAARTVDAAIEWLRENGRPPFFLWVHFQDPHGPYAPVPPFDEMFLKDGRGSEDRLSFNETISGLYGIPNYQRIGDHDRVGFYVARYDGEIAYFDQQFGRLLEALKLHGAYDEALIVFTADHGEGMGEFDYYFAHGAYPYNGALHVPMVLRWHGEQRVVDTPVQLIDIPPTVLGAVGLPANEAWRGQELLAPDLTTQPIYAESHSFRTLILGRHLLTHNDRDDRYVLFDIVDDPGHENELRAAPRSALVREMKDHLRRLDQEDRVGTEQVVLDGEAEQVERMRALGYVRE